MPKSFSNVAPQEPANADATPLARRDWIAGLEKGLGLLEVFSDVHPRINASQAATLCGLTRTAARRHLLTLAHLGYLSSDGKLFWLAPRVLRLGQSYLESARLPRIVQPFLQRISAGTHEIAYLAVLDGDDIVYVARNGPSRVMSVMNAGYVLGSKVPAHVTAAGTLMLAMQSTNFIHQWLSHRELKAYTAHTVVEPGEFMDNLKRIHQQGWAHSEQQLELGHRGVAVPLRDSKSDVVGTLSVTMPMGQESAAAAVARVLPLLRDTAQTMRNLI